MLCFCFCRVTAPVHLATTLSHLSQPDAPHCHPLPVTQPCHHPPPHTRHIATCLTCTPLSHTSQLHTLYHCLLAAACPMLLPPSQPHMPCHHMLCSCTGYAAPLAATYIILLHALQLHRPHCHPSCSCICHVAACLIAAHIISLHTLQLDRPHRCPHSCTCHVTACLAAA